MNYFDYLKKKFSFYCISAVVFGCALFALITVGRYRSHMTSVLSDMETVVQNKDRVTGQIQKIDDLDRYFKNKFNLNLNNVNMERHVFRALDSINSRFQNAVITVSRFENTGGMQELPVAINTPIHSYAVVIDTVQYLEAFTLPDFEIRHLAVRKGQVGDVTLTINGSFVMPSFVSGGQT